MPRVDPTKPAVVYRACDSDGAVLYVGMTTQLPVRIKTHARTAPWWPRVAFVDHNDPTSVQEALAEEHRQIQSLRPAFNWVSNPDHGAPRGPRRRSSKLRVSFFVSHELLDQFRLAAKRNHRTLSQELRRLMQDAVDSDAA